MTESQDWLDTGSDASRITPAAKLTDEKKRAKSMQKKLLGKNRTWACDGEYIWLRRKQANPATLERHERFIASAEYKYVETQDDIEIFKLQPSSPFRRKDPIDLTQLDMYNVRRQAALAACRRDWVTYVDALEELAGRIKGMYDPGFARTVFDETREAIEISVQTRNGPSRGEIDREVKATRKRHGLSADRKILLPT